MASADELWSGSRETLQQRMEYFLGNETLADMTFLVGADFYNALHLIRIDNDELRIEDVPYEPFLDFLRYCYTGRLNLKPENANNIMKLAYRFNMKPLIKKCETEIWEMIKSESCLKLLTQYDFLPKESPLKIRISNEISLNFLKITEDQSMMETFTNLSLKAVDDIADVKSLYCEEVKMFEALMKWSSRSCEKAGINPTPQNLRKSLDYVFYKIRFPTMRSEDFMRIVANYPMMFTGTEVTDIARKMRESTEGIVAEGTGGSNFSNISRETQAYGIVASVLNYFNYSN
ncbi:BTB domain-containing protein [Sergentomyia squamirostris]